MTSPPRAVAITGASGLVGRHLCEHFRRAGWGVRALMRRVDAYPFQSPGIEVVRLDLPDTIDATAFAGVDAVIHAAYATRATRLADAQRVNELGTANVLAAARAAGVRRFVFLSSQAAHGAATSYYGRSKLAIESGLDPSRDLIVRPGLVLAADGGLALRLWETVARMPVVPLFDGGRQPVQTIHVDDLCAAIERALDSGVTGTLHVAEPVGVTMRQLLEMFARAAGVKPVMLSIPSAPAMFMLRAVEFARIPLAVTSENLRGLIAMRHVDTAPDLARLGMAVRDAGQSVADLAPRTGIPDRSRA